MQHFLVGTQEEAPGGVELKFSLSPRTGLGHTWLVALWANQQQESETAFLKPMENTTVGRWINLGWSLVGILIHLGPYCSKNHIILCPLPSAPSWSIDIANILGRSHSLPLSASLSLTSCHWTEVENPNLSIKINKRNITYPAHFFLFSPLF